MILSATWNIHRQSTLYSVHVDCTVYMLVQCTLYSVLLEIAECWRIEFQQEAIFADDFLIFSYCNFRVFADKISFNLVFIDNSHIHKTCFELC